MYLESVALTQYFAWKMCEVFVKSLQKSLKTVYIQSHHCYKYTSKKVP